MNSKPGFSLREYLLQQHNAEELSVKARIQIGGVWAKANRHRSIREFVK